MKKPSRFALVVVLVCLSSGLVVLPTGAEQPRVPESSTSSPRHIEVVARAGAVEFFAVGWPSALKVHGKGTGPEGSLTVSGDRVHGALAFDLRTLKTGIDLRDRHMKENYLQTERFPHATLTLSGLDVGQLPAGPAFGPVTVPFQGTLSLHGVSKLVSGEARIKRNGTSLEAAAAFSVKLADFGIEVPSYLGITIADKVDVKTSFSTTLERDNAVATR